jgi:diguanylate cyclase (GGDEF)-like protein/PAS domain S-box-containing protein
MKPSRTQQSAIRRPLFIVVITIIFSLLSVALYWISDDLNTKIQRIYKEKKSLTIINNLYQKITILQKIRGLRQLRMGGSEYPIDKLNNLLNTFNIDAILEDIELPIRYKKELFNWQQEIQSLNQSEDKIFQPMQQLVNYSQQIEFLIATIRTIADYYHLSMENKLLEHDLGQLLAISFPKIAEHQAKIRGLLAYGAKHKLKTVSKQLYFEVTTYQVQQKQIKKKLLQLSSLHNNSLQKTIEAISLWQKATDKFINIAQQSIDIGLNKSIIKPIDLFSTGTHTLDLLEKLMLEVSDTLDSLLDKQIRTLKIKYAFVLFGSCTALLLLFLLLVKLYRCNYQAFSEIAHTVKQLQLTELRYNSLFISSIDALIIMDRFGIIQEANPATIKLFGHQKKQLVNQNVKILVPSLYQGKHDSYLNDYLEAGKNNNIGVGREVSGHHKDGHIIPLILSIYKFNVDETIFFIGSLRDITAQKAGVQEILNAYEKMEEQVDERTKQLSISNKKLQDIVTERDKQNRKLRLYSKVYSSASEAIMVTDKDQKIIDVNPAFCRITGYSSDEIMGSTPSRFASGKHDTEFFKSMWDILLETGSWHGEIWDKRKDGRIFPKQLSINSVYDESGDISQYIAIFSDISSNKEVEKQLEYLAYKDPLTQLNNRTMFQFLLNMALETAAREKTHFALLFIDLDQFKQVNDTLGHSKGDKLLIEVASRLKRCIRKSDIISRIGGDEFTIILPKLHNNESAALIAQKIIDSVSEPVQLENDTLHVGASIGISIYPQDGKNVEMLSKHADIAMYHVKESGRNGYQYFDHAIFEKSQKRLDLGEALRYALEQNQFELYYQPKINIKSGNITGAEALIRWNDPKKGLIPPFKFIPVAESSGLIIPMGEWITRQACKQLKQWSHNSITAKYRLAINLSPLQFQQDNLTDVVADIMQQEGVTDGLDIEVTESMLLHDLDKVIKTLNIFKDMRVGIALDDFGTGFSSLSNLKLLPIEYLKVDRSFIIDIASNADDAAIVSAIVSMGHQLGLKVIAEGIEDEVQLQYMQKLNCNEAQGYLYSPPLPAEKFTDFVENYSATQAKKRLTIDKLQNT